MYTLAPSIYVADYMHLQQQIHIMERAGVTSIHIDIMDGRFVPNLSFGPDFVRELRLHTNMKLDVHLMMEEPYGFIKDFGESGADVITVHYEACQDMGQMLDAIHALGIEAGVALKPETELEELSPDIWRQADVMQIMTVEPGLKGQHFIPDSCARITYAKRYIRDRGLTLELEVDGDITPANLPDVMGAGADIIVVGKGLFNGDLNRNLRTYLDIMNRAGEEEYALFNRN